MLSNLTPAELNQIDIWFNATSDGRNVQSIVDLSCRRLEDLEGVAVKAGRLAAGELMTIFHIFLEYRFLLDVGEGYQGGFPAFIQRVYALKPYHPDDMLVLEMEFC